MRKGKRELEEMAGDGMERWELERVRWERREKRDRKMGNLGAGADGGEATQT